MKFNLEIVCIDAKYCDYLREYDDRVTYNFNEKDNRPFIGILFKVNDYEYFAPLISPKEKHKKMKNSLDFFKIKNGELGAINFNNMIPVNKNNYSLINLDKKTLTLSEMKYQKLLKEQLRWLNSNYNQVKSKSYKLYNLYITNKLPKNIWNRCCNYPLLEQISEQYQNNILETV